VLAYLAALVFVFQLPGPATCSKSAWRFTAVTLEIDAAAESEAGEPTAETAAVLDEGGSPRDPAPRVAWTLVPRARPHPVLDAGTTRAPPAA
jgi:hypothetical protein